MVFESHLMQTFSASFTAVAILDDLTTFFLLTLWTLLEQLISNWRRLICHQCTKAAPSPGLVALSSEPASLSDLWLPSPSFYGPEAFVFSHPCNISLILQNLKTSVFSLSQIVLDAYVEAEKMRNRSFWFVEARTSCCREYLLVLWCACAQRWEDWSRKTKLTK